MQLTDVWYEKYRPQTLEEVILPDALKNKIKVYLKDGAKNMPHLGLFSRMPGTGKSTLAKVILKETQAEALWINASLDKGIDVLRTKIQRFSSQARFKECIKIVVMDEFDHFSKDGQAAFRGFIDEFGNNVRFIFTGNYKENIIEPLLDRLEVYDFNQFNKEQIVKSIYYRLQHILKSENIEYETKDVIEVIKNNYPRIRKMIGDLNKNIHNNKLILSSSDIEFNNILNYIKNKNFDLMLKEVYAMGNPDTLYKYLSDNITAILEPQKNISAYIILSKYQHMAVTARDRHLNAVGCCCELMKL